MNQLKSKLYIVGTPIGNLGDITYRAVETLKMVEIIACEDSRVTQKLLNFLNIKKENKYISCHEHNELASAEKIIEQVKLGKNVAYVSDAGMPTISDPGFMLIKFARENNIQVEIIPGVSSILLALAGSGMDSIDFTVYGFLRGGKKQRDEKLAIILADSKTVVLFETPHKLLKTLAVINQIDSRRIICIAREMTKLFEEFKIGTAEQLIKHYSENVLKGELILVIEKAEAEQKNLKDFKDLIFQKLQKNSKSIVAREMSEEYGFSKNEVYKFILTEF